MLLTRQTLLPTNPATRHHLQPLRPQLKSLPVCKPASGRFSAGPAPTKVRRSQRSAIPGCTGSGEAVEAEASECSAADRRLAAWVAAHPEASSAELATITAWPSKGVTNMAAPDDLTTSTTGDSDRDTVPDAEGLILAYEALVWRAQELVWNVDTLYTKLGEIDIHNLDLVKEEEALEELQRELADHMRSCDALKDNTADDCSTDSMDLSSLAIKIAALRDKQQAFPGGAADNEAWQADLKRAAVGLQNGFDRVQAGLDRAKVVIRAVQDTPLDVARYRDGLRDHMYNGLDLGRRAISVAANDF